MEIGKVAAILVLYRCKPADSLTLKSLDRAAEKANFTLPLYIYDNSSEAQPKARFNNIRIEKIHHNPVNPGVSAAYNFFASELKASADWLLLLDQDTNFPESYFTELQELSPPASIKLILPQLVQHGVLISPHVFRNGYSYSEKTLAAGIHSLKNLSALNSGMLIKTQTFHAAGGYAEDVPLYFSDQVFISRLKRMGVEQFSLLRATCQHSMSSNDVENMTSFKERYRYFVQGARSARKYLGPFTKAGLSAVVLMRGLKLSLRHRDWHYLRTLFGPARKE